MIFSLCIHVCLYIANHKHCLIFLAGSICAKTLLTDFIFSAMLCFLAFLKITCDAPPDFLGFFCQSAGSFQWVGLSKIQPHSEAPQNDKSHPVPKSIFLQPPWNSGKQLVPMLRGLKCCVNSHMVGYHTLQDLHSGMKHQACPPTTLAFLHSLQGGSCGQTHLKPNSIHWMSQATSNNLPNI